MNKLLIIYPPLFNCYDKFNRKVLKITQNLGEFSFIYPDDANGFIKRFASEHFPDALLDSGVDWKTEDVSHAIVFDDGEEFFEEADWLTANNFPIRKIGIAITRVINIKRQPEYQGDKSTSSYEYIGRGSYWGNPYSMYEEGDDRDEVIRKYKYDFEFEKFPNKEKTEVYKLAGKRLGCFCKPQSCHGDVLADYLNTWDDGK